MTDQLTEKTGAQAGLSGDEQIRIAIHEIVEKGGVAEMAQIYDAVERRMKDSGARLS